MSIKKNYKIVTSFSQYKELIEHIENTEYQAFDVEATGLNVRKDKVIGYGISGKVGVGYYVPIYYWNVKTETLDPYHLEFDPVEPLKKLSQIITWNGSYDISITRNDLGVDLTNALVSEAMLMKHTVQEEGPFALKTTAIELQEHLGLDAEKAANEEEIELKENIKKNGGSVTKKNYELYKADMPVIAKYCAADCDLTLRIFEYYYDMMEDQNLINFFYDEEVMPLYKLVTMNMESKGVKLDLPYINENYAKLTKLMDSQYKLIMDTLEADSNFQDWLINVSTAEFPEKKTGKFAQEVVKLYQIDLPLTKSGTFSLSKKNLDSYPDQDCVGILFLKGKCQLDEEDANDISKKLWKEKQGGNYINLNSKAQLADLVFNQMGYKPLSKTPTGNPQFNDNTIDYLADEGLEWAKALKKYNKLLKIKTAYYDRFLDGHEDGYYYFSFDQHGTISGRYGSDAQQLPRPMEDGEDDPDVVYFNNTIRRFFIAGEGRVFLDNDYVSLEPHVFAHVSGDEKLRDIFRNNHDFYSTIAIATENIKGVSADKNAENYLGKINKPLRQKAKAYSLGIAYGLTPYALSKSLEIDLEEAVELCEGYLNGFPSLKKWMDESRSFVKENGYITTETGRVRHLPKVPELYKKHGDKLLDYKYRASLEKKLSKHMSKKDAKDKVLNAYRDYKNGLNNGLNFQIQGLSASIVNRSMIEIQRKISEMNLDAWICSTVHDQVIINCAKEHAEECKKMMQAVMENHYKLSVNLEAIPEVSTNWRDGH